MGGKGRKRDHRGKSKGNKKRDDSDDDDMMPTPAELRAQNQGE
jgi:hypothetical protein